MMPQMTAEEMIEAFAQSDAKLFSYREELERERKKAQEEIEREMPIKDNKPDAEAETLKDCEIAAEEAWSSIQDLAARIDRAAPDKHPVRGEMTALLEHIEKVRSWCEGTIWL